MSWVGSDSGLCVVEARQMKYTQDSVEKHTRLSCVVGRLAAPLAYYYIVHATSTIHATNIRIV